MNKKILIFIISSDNIEFIKKAVLEIDNIEGADLLIVDEGSEYSIIDEISDYKSAKCIVHEQPLGYGACLNKAIHYSRDYDYDYLISIDCNSSALTDDAANILSNLDYGYDIVSCSRILENFSHSQINEEILEFFTLLTDHLNGIMDTPITDPLSINIGINLKTAEQLDITDISHGALLQIYIQSNFFGLNIIEIPSESKLVFGEEIFLYENPIQMFTALIETENYLYNRGTLN